MNILYLQTFFKIVNIFYFMCKWTNQMMDENLVISLKKGVRNIRVFNRKIKVLIKGAT